ncbi:MULTISPECIES: YhdP family protein [unclassified Pseudomonas]|uniref:YhdP family protein n=1 Tax=unclassified Pseudomonas TaxID=196821 RepID=UPI0008C1977D|nr:MULTISPECIES: YhdP family protein [unclassified Pseudomonas]PMV26622.1 TIGR02099 family protein [Pseudomonas sp. FW305-3-2-15-C-TSA2]PMV31993.1 TIGR02099 family protein [Pseudomonas sp. DP16D-L5]PMV41210.1 TIGR02099 family protein [Pseudomonas sp. FW305-3-2-15-A-LB2]PMV48161.1 TIGR02099 family protein [Pseudomonas sp. FW305-3-2-15-C-R2A1]PMV54618.1 TIGR02099 family protein [Pseudomonas sp. FW305-3-2-15-C-LB1]
MERLIRFFAALTRWGLGLCALSLVLAAVYVSLGRELTPLVAEYRAEVEAKAQAAVDMPLHIGSLEGRWSGFAPVLLAHDVMLGEGSSALRLDQVEVVPDVWASLMAREVRIAHLQVSGLQLSVKEDKDGKWALQGLPVQDDQPLDPEQLLTNMQKVKRVSLLDSQVTLQPFDQAPVTLTYVGLNLHTGVTRQRLDARLTLPDGQPLAMSLRTRIRASQWKDGEVQAYLSLPQSDWARWIPAKLTQQWKLTQFKAGGEFWLTWAKGAVQSAVVRLNSPQVKGQYAERKPVHIENLALTAYLQRSDTGLSVLFDSLAMSLGETRWESRLQLRQTLATDKDLEVWKLQADRLDLTPITPLLNALAPLPEGFAKTVEHLKATGLLRNVLVDFRPQDTTDKKVSFAANLERIGFDAYFGAPAARNVSGSISGDLGQGELRMDSKDFSLHLDPIFAKPWQYLQANARLTWKLDKEGFTLIAPYIKVLGEEGKIAADFLIRLHFDHNQEDYMDLRVGMVDGDGRFTPKYLPAVLSPALDEWLRTAILKGAVDQGFFQYQGSLNHDALPASRNISLFFKVHDAELAFQPGWPHVSKVNGEVFVEESGVRILASKGQLLDTKVKDIYVNIPHAPAGKDSHLLLTGGFAGGLGDGLKILQEAPIGTASTFSGWKGEGDLQGGLDLDIPLAKGAEPKIVVDFKTDKARLQLAEPPLDLTQLKGEFRFDSAKGLSGQNITAQAFDRPITAQIVADGKPGNISTRVNAKGQVTVKRLTDWLKISQPLPVSGDIPYQLQVTLDGADSQLMVSSNLKGVAVDLPAPFGMPASQGRDSVFRMTLQGAERRYWFDYGELANFTFAAPPDKFNDGRGELFLGDGDAVLPGAKGLRIRGVLSELDIDPWKKLVDRYAGNDPGGSAKQLLSGADFKIGKLTGFGTQFDRVNLQLDRKPAAWGVQLDSQQAKGSVNLPDAKGAPIAINLQYVKLPAVDPSVQADENAPDPLANIDPKDIPALDIAIDQLFQGPDLIGAWSLKIRPTAKGLAFNNLDLGLKGMQLKGAGGWEGAAGDSSSWYKGRLDGKNIGDVLKGWGYAPTVTSQDFHLDVDGRWPGSPAYVGPKRFSGSLDAAFRNGQFVEVEGGAQALRVFGLLNFNSIGRRLRLDFSDLLGKGLSYDRVKGLLAASNGVFVTREPITMTGPSSNLELNGTLDLVADRVDAKLLVTLPVTNNLPIAALIVGAPAIGGALFLIDKLIGDRVSRFASVQYKVEGPWKDPKITFDKPFEKPN